MSVCIVFDLVIIAFMSELEVGGTRERDELNL
jgi:hypothetical protein